MDYTESEISMAMQAHNCTREEAIATYCEQIRNYRANESTQRQKTQYQLDRKQAYPPISDQLDMLWHAMDSGEIPKANTFYTNIQTIKNSYPKS